MSHTLTRIGQSVLIALTAALSLALAGPANAAGGATYNNAEITIKGGNAAAFSGCLNYAKKMAKHDKPAQSNTCKNFARADGGSVTLKNVLVTVFQLGTSGKTHNNAEINIIGGDAVAVASCVNYLQGTANATQKNTCKNSADARGGDVTLKNVDITIIQEG